MNVYDIGCMSEKLSTNAKLSIFCYGNFQTYKHVKRTLYGTQDTYYLLSVVISIWTLYPTLA